MTGARDGSDREAPRVRAFRNERIENLRAGSRVESDAASLRISTDLCGFDKVYYSFAGGEVRCSDRLQDLYDRPLDGRLWDFQREYGYVPYPFTVLEGVYKSLPGATQTWRKTAGVWSGEARVDLSAVERLGTVKKSSDPADWRGRLMEAADRFKAAVPEKMVLSFSGGFDSLLLGHLFKDRIVSIVHYADDPAESERFREQLGPWLPDVPWHVIGPEACAGADMEDYFRAAQQPACDSGGVTLYLMMRELEKRLGPLSGYCLLDGHMADVIFMNKRRYFKEWLSGALLLGGRGGLEARRSIGTATIGEKIFSYFKSSRMRFYEFHTDHHPFAADLAARIEEVRALYARVTRRFERADASSVTDALLLYSNRCVEKFGMLSARFGCRYAPFFFSAPALEAAMSMPAARKAGYRSGKRALKEAFPEVTAAPFVSRGFRNQAVSRRLFGRSGATARDYYAFYADGWRRHNYEALRDPGVKR